MDSDQIIDEYFFRLKLKILEQALDDIPLQTKCDP
jgi:hypothetical protein